MGAMLCFALARHWDGTKVSRLGTAGPGRAVAHQLRLARAVALAGGPALGYDNLCQTALYQIMGRT